MGDKPSPEPLLIVSRDPKEHFNEIKQYIDGLMPYD